MTWASYYSRYLLLAVAEWRAYEHDARQEWRAKRGH